MLTSYAVDITSTLAFGIDLNTLEHGKNELQQHIQRVFTMLNFRLFFPIPYWRWVRLPADRRLERSLSEINRAVAGFIAQARERMSERPGAVRGARELSGGDARRSTGGRHLHR